MIFFETRRKGMPVVVTQFMILARILVFPAGGRTSFRTYCSHCRAWNAWGSTKPRQQKRSLHCLQNARRLLCRRRLRRCAFTLHEGVLHGNRTTDFCASRKGSRKGSCPGWMGVVGLFWTLVLQSGWREIRLRRTCQWDYAVVSPAGRGRHKGFHRFLCLRSDRSATVSGWTTPYPAAERHDDPLPIPVIVLPRAPGGTGGLCSKPRCAPWFAVLELL